MICSEVESWSLNALIPRVVASLPAAEADLASVNTMDCPKVTARCGCSKVTSNRHRLVEYCRLDHFAERTGAEVSERVQVDRVNPVHITGDQRENNQG